MTDHPHAELLPCPNPWCDRGEPCLRQGCDRIKQCTWAQVYCMRCQTAGPREICADSAVRAWNTRKDADGSMAVDTDWHDATQPAPEGQPVMALYRAFNRPDGKWMRHVVWWREGGWRNYPFTANKAYVDRWRPLAAC